MWKRGHLISPTTGTCAFASDGPTEADWLRCLHSDRFTSSARRGDRCCGSTGRPGGFRRWRWTAKDPRSAFDMSGVLQRGWTSNGRLPRLPAARTYESCIYGMDHEFPSWAGGRRHSSSARCSYMESRPALWRGWRQWPSARQGRSCEARCG